MVLEDKEEKKRPKGFNALTCYKTFKIKIDQELSGCEGGNLTSRWIIKKGYAVKST